MLKRLYDILSVARWCAVGVFIGTSLYVVFDYIARFFIKRRLKREKRG